VLFAPSLPVLQELLDVFCAHSLPTGLEPNPAKCSFWTNVPESECPRLGPASIPRENGLVLDVMGTFIAAGGPTTERVHALTAAMDRVVDEALETGRKLLPSSLQSFLLALRLCIVPKLMHLVRLCELPDGDVLDAAGLVATRHPIARFDTEIAKLLCERLELLPNELPGGLLVNLPLRLGGLGLHSMSLTRDAALAGALVSMLAPASKVPALWQVGLRQMLRATRDLPALRATCFLGHSLAALDRTGVTPDADFCTFVLAGDELTGRRAQHTLMQMDLERRAAELRAVPAGTRDPDVPVLPRVMNSTACVSASAWLSSFPSPLFKVDDCVMRHAVLMRLGVPMAAPLALVLGAKCPRCGEDLIEGHDMQCAQAVRSLQIQCHNAVVTLLSRMCRLTGEAVHVEPYVRTERVARRPDLTVLLPGPAAGGLVRHHVDVAVGNVLAPSYVAAAREGGVPGLLERGKVADYRVWLEHDGGVLHPFGCSTFAQLGPEANAFMELVKNVCERKEAPFCGRWWMARIGVCLAVYAARMADRWRGVASEAVNKRAAGAGLLAASEEVRQLLGSDEDEDVDDVLVAAGAE